MKRVKNDQRKTKKTGYVRFKGWEMKGKGRKTRRIIVEEREG